MTRNASLVACALFFMAAAMGCAETKEALPASKGPIQDSRGGIIAREYHIGPEDVLEVSIWQNADLSRVVTVRPDGMISLPLVGDIRAAGFTPDRLKTEITQKLQPFVSDPAVSIIVQQINSWKIFVQGEVRTPGAYPIRRHTSISQAITMAGGFTVYAKKSKILVVRREYNQTRTIRVNYNGILSGKRPQDDIVLEPGDTVIVP